MLSAIYRLTDNVIIICMTEVFDFNVVTQIIVNVEFKSRKVIVRLDQNNVKIKHMIFIHGIVS